MSEQAKRRNESEAERLDRNLMELIQELRVAIPGIQFLFAFLLVVPFQQGWPSVTDFERTVYYVTLLLTVASSICLLAPTARHRLRFRELDKEWVVQSANRLLVAGMVFLAGAICGAVTLVTLVVYDGALAITVLAAMGVLIGWFWFVAPTIRELRERD
jgi:hypothetical protein